ncbi:DNA helicase UvrD [Candidatus Falkowbacteria bacterium]|nr:DNA helicase UvrD [Candidatus Falkowbacteria bacterium]
MRQIADLHIHSKYSRACSRDLTLENIERTCRIKGVDIIATGDFTYPAWFESIKNELEEIPPTPFNKGGQRGILKGTDKESGLYKLKSAKDNKIRFILSTELALIYKDPSTGSASSPQASSGQVSNKVRRIHIVIHAPNVAAVEELNKFLDKKYNIRSDGRPILGMSAPALMKLCLSIHPQFLIYPAHIWTPWFSVFGSKSGFNTMEECFSEYTKDIYAYETGLSSDPEMNWRLSTLDKLTLLSNSDAHSLANIGREANIFELENITYDEIYEAIKKKDINKLKGTIEFYPEEGMYHFDGHRDCGVSFSPEQTKKNKGICPVCKKPLTIGVLNRVEELANRPVGAKPDNQPGFLKLVELDKIIAEALNIKSRRSRKVQNEYNNLIKKANTEMNVLIDEPLENLKKLTLPAVAEGIKRIREGRLIIKPGFDGQYGEIKIFTPTLKKRQAVLDL